MNLCKDCSHFRPQVRLIGGRLIEDGHARCAVVLDPVYGSPEHCSMSRTMSRECRPEGVLWLQRPEGQSHATLQFWVSEKADSATAVQVLAESTQP